ncbi:MAG: beta strand repeat-containing protein, partial [Victivallaceae bacterium]
ATEMTNLTIYEGGVMYDVSYYSKMTGKFIYGNGSSQTFTLSSGTVTGYVLGSGMNLCGDIMKYSVASARPQLTNVAILEGGILDGFRTGRKGDDTKLSTGTYTAADGTKTSWSFGQGTAKNMYINSGCFVIQGISTAGATDAGVTENTTLDGGILVVANGSVNTGMITRNNAALQIYGSANITGGVNQDTGATFSVVGGVASGLLIENGGFYYSNAGTVIEDSVVTGKRSVASGNADYAQSVLQITSGGTARDVELTSGALLILDGAFSLENVTMDESVTVSWKTFNPNFSLVNTVINGYEDVSWDSATKTLTGWLHNGVGTANFIPAPADTVKYVNLTIKDIPYNTLALDANKNIVVDMDGVILDLNGAVKGVSATSGAWTNTWAGNWQVGAGSKVSNLQIWGGDVGILFDVNGVILDNHYTSLDCYVDFESCTATNLTIKSNNAVFVGSNGTWGANYSIVNGVNMSTGTLSLRNGEIKDVTATGGKLVIVGNTDTYTKGVFKLTGDWNLSNFSISCTNSQNDINLDQMNNALTLGGGCNISANIVGGSSSVLTLKGVGNNMLGYDGTAATGVDVGTVVFDTTGVWFSNSNLVGFLKNITADTLTFKCGLGQNLFYLGETGSSEGSYTATFNFEMSGQKFSMKIGETKSLNGFEIKLYEEYLSDFKVYAARLSVKSTVGESTDFQWTNSWSNSVDFAPKYVNKLAETTSGTILLGAKSEGAGGNVIANAFGGYMTGGMVDATINSTAVYGGGSGTELDTTWVRVSGGSKNTIYGGGINDTITDGTNVYISGDSTTTTGIIFGGGQGSTISVGEHNVYAVNMDVGGGRHRYVYGGGNGGTINGDIGVWVYDCQVASLYAGGGNSNVNGNIKTYLNLPAYLGNKMTGNFYGGAVAAVDASAQTGVDTTVTGNVSMTLDAGDYQGIIFGGSRAWGTTAAIGGTVTVTVNAITSTDNVKMLKYGSTAWVIGGSQIQNNGTTAASGTIAGGVVMNLGASNLVNVVGAGQSTGVNCVLAVSDVTINIANTTITDSVFGAGYAAEGGAVAVDSVTINITGNEGSNTTIGGSVFAAGKTVGANGGTVSVEGDVMVNFSGVAERISVGTVNALGKGACSVSGTKSLGFTDISGTLGGMFVNFDAVMFAGDTQLTGLSNGVDTAEWYFNAWNRAEAMPFVTDAESFNLVGDERVIGLSFATTSNVSYDLMDVSDEEAFDDVTVKFFAQDGTEIGSCAFGETIAIGTKGYVSLDIDDTGMLVASYTKGQLA